MIVTPAAKNRMRSLWRSDAGSSIVEFAILAPVFVLLLIGLIEIGRYTYFALLAANAARAGAQYGAQNLITADDTTGMNSAASQDGQNLANWTVTATPLCSVSGAAPATCAGGGAVTNTIYYVEVDVSGTFTSLFRYPGIPQNVTVSGKSVMRVANQ